MIIPNREAMKGLNTNWRYLFERRFARPHKKILCAGGNIYEPVEVGATHACDIKEICREGLIKNGFKGEFKVADVKDLPYEDKEFDCVLCCEVLEHVGSLENVEKAISEILRVGKNFLISVPYKNDIRHNMPCVYFDEKILASLLPNGTYIFSKHPFLYASNSISKWLIGKDGK